MHPGSTEYIYIYTYVGTYVYISLETESRGLETVKSRLRRMEGDNMKTN
jgi:hypothetical protein